MNDAITAYQRELADIHGQKAEHTAEDFLGVLAANRKLFNAAIQQRALMPSQFLVSFFAQVTGEFLQRLAHGSELPAELRDQYEPGTVVFGVPFSSPFVFVVPPANRSVARRAVSQVQETIWAQVNDLTNLERRLRDQIRLTVLPNTSGYLDGERVYKNYGHLIIPSEGKYHLYTIGPPTPKFLPLSTVLIPGPKGVLVARAVAQFAQPEDEGHVTLISRDRLIAYTVDDAIAEVREYYRRSDSTGTLAIARRTQGFPLQESIVPIVERLYSARLGVNDGLPRQQKPRY